MLRQEKAPWFLRVWIQAILTCGSMSAFLPSTTTLSEMRHPRYRSPDRLLSALSKSGLQRIGLLARSKLEIAASNYGGLQADTSLRINATDKRFFWLALYAQPIAWAAMAIISIVRLHFVWLILVGTSCIPSSTQPPTINHKLPQSTIPPSSAPIPSRPIHMPQYRNLAIPLEVTNILKTELTNHSNRPSPNSNKHRRLLALRQIQPSE